MKTIKVHGTVFKFFYRLMLLSKKLLGRKKCNAFSRRCEPGSNSISNIYVINLDRKPKRWKQVQNELSFITDSSGIPLNLFSKRVSAIDALEFKNLINTDKVDSLYSLAEQLYVDPRGVLPVGIDLEEKIQMSRQEIAVAMSHIKTWKMVASGEDDYVLVLEDDVCFRSNFSKYVEKIWKELKQNKDSIYEFDILYLSHKEVDCGAEKTRLTENTFQLFRGVWYLSGYVISKKGARRLLGQLPVRGPVDLWMNHKFGQIKALMASKSTINQRIDEKSENFYSVLPVLSKTGILNTEAPGLFQSKISIKPVFVIGEDGSGLTSLGMALSMLGYRCCSDLQKLPREEYQFLMSGSKRRKFDAYVNIGSIEKQIGDLADVYPEGRLIFLADGKSNKYVSHLSQIWGDRFLVLNNQASARWNNVCKFLGIAPPASPFPKLEGLGQRTIKRKEDGQLNIEASCQWLKADPSPWIIPSKDKWTGLGTDVMGGDYKPKVHILDNFDYFDEKKWFLRNDTFPGNLALFSPSNFEVKDGSGARITVCKENMGVREFSSSALTTRDSFLFGRFEAVVKPSRAEGLITGIFLHRDSPRQEIDVEFLGKDPNKMLVNVYYNPGCNNSRFDYGYRGTPALVELGFDATKEFHTYAIEWSPNQIKWYVDRKVVHSRYNWHPTPIPHLPMRFHINLWPSMSHSLAGRINTNSFPASIDIQSVFLKVEDHKCFDVENVEYVPMLS